MALKLKVCKDCGADESTVTFPRHRATCHGCTTKRAKTYPSAQRAVRLPYLKTWRINNPLKQREYDIRASYDATPEQITAILDWSGGPCSACGKHLQKFGTGLDEACIDHNHSTLILRGIVCGACNRALGMVRDSVEHLERLVAYLKGELQFSYWA